VKRYEEIVLADFEYIARDCERVDPVCCVSHELHSGKTRRIWRDELKQLQKPPYSVGSDSLFVAFYAPPRPENVLDLFAEFRCLTNGLELPMGRNLLGALHYFGLSSMEAAEKDTMRNLILGGGPWNAEEQTAILNYCQEDIDFIRELDKQFKIGDLCFDRWQMDLVAPFLKDMGCSDDEDEQTRHLIEFGQGYKSMSPACRVLEELALAGKLSHGGHKVLTYMMSCVALATDDAENIKPSKRKSTGRIDAVVALAMALYPASLTKPAPARSIYEPGGERESGVIVL
jgi:hypothetical protein